MSAPIYQAVDHDEIGCYAMQPDQYRLICTRPEGHDGPHAAHGVDDLMPLAVWS